jgi:hypothetical protein
LAVIENKQQQSNKKGGKYGNNTSENNQSVRWFHRCEGYRRRLARRCGPDRVDRQFEFFESSVDLTAFKTAIDSLNALIAQATADGGKKAIADKNHQRTTVVQMLRLLARYVEVTSKSDLSVFQTSGFQAASNTKVKGQPLSEKIRKIERGSNSGQVPPGLVFSQLL